jgi:predicted Mrr-cat superfamily restriction endonuclease
VHQDWREYQVQVAEFFRLLGCSAQIEARVKGTRGTHKVDVLVSFVQFSFENRWIVECKSWNSSIPKEKVLALQSIVQDVGAEKGILLSEAGFQSGAIACANNTNIILSSIADLQEQAKVEINAAVINRRLDEAKSLLTGISGLSKTLKDEKYKDGHFTTHIFPPGGLEIYGRLILLKEALKRALQDQYPIVYDITDEQTQSLHMIERRF